MTSEKIVRQLRMELHTEAAAEIEQLRDALSRCEWWLSTHPEGKAMRDVCRAALHWEKKEPLAGARGGLDGGERL